MSPLMKRSALIAVPVVAALWWLNGAHTDDALDPSSPPQPQLSIESASSAQASVSAQVAVAESASNRIYQRPDDLAPTDIMSRFNALNRYQRGTQAVSADDYDLLNPGARYEQPRGFSRDPTDPDSQWRVHFTADRFFITDEDASTLNLRLWKGSELSVVRVQWAAAEMRDDRGQVVTMPLPVIYSGGEAVIRLRPSDYWPELAGPLIVELAYSSSGLDTETARLDFHYTGPQHIPAEFIDVVADAAVAGNLEFDIALDVRRSGSYRISALVQDIQGVPIGRAQTDVWLEPSRQIVKLAFDGLLFHDKNALGPFYLTTLRGERLDPLSWSGSDQIPIIQGQYQTRRYSASDFNSESIANLHVERMKQHYEQAIARGVRFEPVAN